ncbi:MAG: sulfatase-like hydrolase/transferase [Polyangiales bacterium]
MTPRASALVSALACAACERAVPAASAQPSPAPAHAPAPAPAVAPPSAPAPTTPPAQRVGGPPADLNVIMISVDSLRADMPWAGYPRPIAPFLTELEAQSVSYTRAYALSSYTSQSVGGFLGGRLPGELRRDGYFFGTYPSRVLFFPEKLHAAGVRTVTAHAHGYFRRNKAGFEQGFDVYELLPGLHWNPTTDVDITGDRHAALARRLLSDPANTSGRFFAWFHFMDAHDQYQRHPGITPYGRSLRDRYDGEVTYVDGQLREFVGWIRQQPWGARTAIIVTADHGEAFGEHGCYRHAFEVWQPLVRVPWFFVLPGAAPRRIEAPRSHVDLAPTVLELLGAPREPEFTGQSLVAELYGAPAPERDVWVDLARTSNNDRRRALIHGRHKIIAFGDDSRFEVYDIEADPGETTNLRRTDRATYDAMVARYRAAQGSFRVENPYSCRTLTGSPPGRGW